MTVPSAIARIHARQILDSRGRPTVEVDVELHDGSLGRACSPSGASTGRHEAHELRDGDPDDFEGRSVHKAVANVMADIAVGLIGRDALDQERVDRDLREVDGSSDLSRLGANAVLATSLAACRAAAVHKRRPLYRHIGMLASDNAITLPMPMTNILSGGAHAGRGMDIQDFLAVPVGAQSYSDALSMLAKVRSTAAAVLAERGGSVLLADEGGLSPGFETARAALDLMMDAFARAGFRPGEEIAIALDVAASELFLGGRYSLPREGHHFDGREMASFVLDLVRNYPVVSVEDPLDQDDWENWRQFTGAASDLQIVGDDLFVTNQERISRGVEQGAGNAVLIKLNQNGTLSGTLDAMRLARRAGFATVVSARSGETEDAFIADLAVGTGAGQIKIGSVRNSERLSKYNQLLRIEEDPDVLFASTSGLHGRGLNRAA
ncbi:phosphopyruvate hydratase [Bradyrhizobium sp. Pha-3]|uniref:phosphopyruvate hydratase n=1 Tax=Bradyrhizobium sp. Pha-3 TaxID=208375 RepID=UPI0035D524A2